MLILFIIKIIARTKLFDNFIFIVFKKFDYNYFILVSTKLSCLICQHCVKIFLFFVNNTTFYF